MTILFDEFLMSKDALRVYIDGKMVFASPKDGLRPLLEYSVNPSPLKGKIVIYDRVVGNAAALLAARLGCKEIFSPLGSKPGIKTLEQFGIKYHIVEVVEHILQDNGIDMCPMEKLSTGKNPEQFFTAVGKIIKVR